MLAFIMTDNHLDLVMGWIETNTGPPTNLADMIKICPDHKPRGTRPPCVLFQEAKASAKASHDDDAMEWLLIAESHDEGAKGVLRNNRTEVLRRLRS
jgi:hypothetical protein